MNWKKRVLIISLVLLSQLIIFWPLIQILIVGLPISVNANAGDPCATMRCGTLGDADSILRCYISEPRVGGKQLTDLIFPRIVRDKMGIVGNTGIVTITSIYASLTLLILCIIYGVKLRKKRSTS